MTVSHPNQQVCLLRKAISIPLGHGTGHLGKGELVTVINSHGDDRTISLLMDSSQVYTCHEKNLKLVPYDIVKFLLPVMPCSRRYDVFTKLDKDLLTLPLGSHINIARGRTNPNVLGELKYRGEIKDRVGIWFGMKLVGGMSSYCGDSDGSISGNYYMDKYPANSVIFATVDELTIKGTDSSHDSLTLLSNMGDIKDKSSGKATKTLPARSRRSEPKTNQLTCGYAEGDEVIVLKNKHLTAEPGIVRAVFQDAKKRWMLGIELENPVGDSNGTYKGRHMFSCDAQYGLFCDATEAMPKHYYETPNRSHSPTSSNHVTSTTLPHSSSNHVRSASYGATSSYGAPPPAYNESFNSHPPVNPPQREPKSPRPRIKSPKTDFEQAFKMKSSSAAASFAALPSDLVQSINTLTIAGGATVDESMHSPMDTNRTESSSVGSPDKLNKHSPETPEPPPEIDLSLEIGSLVQVSKNCVVHYGVLRWIGNLTGKRYVCAGLELEEEISPPGNNGMYDGIRYFTCPPFRALFCYLHDCAKDRRFEELPVQEVKQYFGPQASPVIEGRVDPPKSIGPLYLGRGRGIQGNRNSCYLDATLYAMFAFDNTMDYVLSGQVEGDVNTDIQKKLKESVVNPLRECGFVGAEHMRVLRDLLSRSSTLGGLETDEKEPEELINVLFTEIFNIKPLLSFRDGATNEISHVNLCQILLERDPHSSTTMPQTQDLLTRYFVSQNLYFHTQPELLLLQVPRSGKDFKLYDTVLPSTNLQLGGLCGGVWGACYICNKKPFFKCPQCYLNQEFACKYSAVPYCESCCKLVHRHPDRQGHTPENATNPTRGIKMVLSAVLCIHTSHYVTYCRVPAPKLYSEIFSQEVQLPGTSSSSTRQEVSNDPGGLRSDSDDLHNNGLDNDSTEKQPYCWVFFDSMADREGGIGGYNIPQVEECPQLEDWLQNPAKLLHERDRAPDFVKRLIKDALLCFYTKDKNS